jgi:hypothetical protein
MKVLSGTQLNENSKKSFGKFLFLLKISFFCYLKSNVKKT